MDDGSAKAASAAQPPKKKGKKAIHAAAARKDAEAKQFDSREAELSAYKTKAEVLHSHSADTEAAEPVQTMPAAETPKAGFLEFLTSPGNCVATPRTRIAGCTCDCGRDGPCD